MTHDDSYPADAVDPEEALDKVDAVHYALSQILSPILQLDDDAAESLKGLLIELKAAAMDLRYALTGEGEDTDE